MLLLLIGFLVLFLIVLLLFFSFELVFFVLFCFFVLLFCCFCCFLFFCFFFCFLFLLFCCFVFFFGYFGDSIFCFSLLKNIGRKGYPPMRGLSSSLVELCPILFPFSLSNTLSWLASLNQVFSILQIVRKKSLKHL